MANTSKASKQLDFEVAFFERLASAYPEFVEALAALGNAYTRKRWYEKGLVIDLKLTQLKPDDAIVWYNLACSYSLLKRAEEAFISLQRAVALGYDDLPYLLKDPDLETLRCLPKFREWLEEGTLSKPS